ncbi:MAG: alpha-L-fucosidase [Tannerella sp.]|jgi:alpha-L-fucosidase|nr:alpha-L-fucosidase [Tannerella sp.]
MKNLSVLSGTLFFFACGVILSQVMSGMLFFFTCGVILSQVISCKGKEKVEVVVPNGIQQVWADAEIGVLIHLDMPVFRPEYDFRQWGTHPDAEIFNPAELNTDQWMETAQKLGATYAVLVAKHCSGFSLWPTEAHDYSVKNSPWKDGKGDIVGDFVASCRKYNIKPGIYASTSANGYFHVDNPGVVQPGAPITQDAYNRIVIRQLTELWSNYGELFEIWFDGGVLATEKGGADVLSLVKKLQPDAIAFQGPYGHPSLIRWVGNEQGVAPYPCWSTADSTTNADGTIVISGLNGDPFASYWCPGESDFTLRWNRSFQGGWFWKAGQDSMMFTIDELMTKYATSVGRNTNMLLGIVIDDRGLVPDADVRQIELLGDAIRAHYGTPFRQTEGTGTEYVIRLEQPTSIDRIVMQEDIAYGERVLEYRVSGKTDGEWVELSFGTNIGHKHIDRFPPRTVTEIKLQITGAKTEPRIKNFAIYETMEK